MSRMKSFLFASLVSITGMAVLAGCSQSFEKEPKKETPPPPPPMKVEAPRSDCKMAVYAFPTGDPRTSVALLEKCMPPQVIVGVPFDFTLTLINTSETLCLDDVVITDKLPTNMKLESATPNPDAQGDTLRWTMGRVNPKETKVIRCKGVVTAAGNVLQCATLSCVPKACVEIVAVQPALKLAKSAPAEVMLCDQIPLRLVVTNSGSGNATDVVVTDSLPAGLMTVDGKNSVTVPVGTLAPNQSKEIVITTKASKTGKYDNTATATASGGLKVSSNSTSTVVKQPVLEIAKKALQDKVLVGRGTGNFTHEITVKNTGDGVAANTVVVDTPPAGVTVVKADGATNVGGKLQWSAGNLAPGASKTMQVTFATAASGTYVNNVTANAVCASPVSASAKTEVSGIPAVLLEVVDDPDPVRVGDSTVYTIIVTNQGSANDADIAVVCEMTDEMQYVSSTGATAGKAEGKKITFTPVTTLAPKQRVEWKVTIKAAKAKDVRFRTVLTTKETKAGGVIEESESTNFYE